MCRHGVQQKSIPWWHCATNRRRQMMTGLLQDLRYALRQLRKSPSFAATAMLVLTLGICASVSIFAFVDAVLIKPLPYANPNRLVDVTESVAMIPRANLSYPDYLDWKKLNNVFSSMDVYNGTGYLLRTPAGTEPVPGVRVSDGFFHTLGITPALGRDFYAGEDLPAAPRTVILSYATWQKRYGGREDVVGEAVTLSGIPHTIVGVLPREFQFAPRGNAEFWTTLHASDLECTRNHQAAHPAEGGRQHLAEDDLIVNNDSTYWHVGRRLTRSCAGRKRNSGELDCRRARGRTGSGREQPSPFRAPFPRI